MSFYTNVQLVGDNLLYLGYEEGQRIQRKFKFSPTLFVVTKKQTKFRTLDGRYAKPVRFESVREARQFVDQYKEVPNFEVHGYDRYLYQFISKEFPDEVDYDFKGMNIMSLDIEVACENGFPNVKECAEEMLSITVQDYQTRKLKVFGTRPYKNTRDDVEFILCDGEQHLLRCFLDYWIQNFPDILTGWNVDGYDIPYICGRLERLFGEKEMKLMSPWGIVKREEIEIKGREQIFYRMLGINVIDYLDLYKKFTYTNQESYRLDHIAFVELGQRKVDHNEFENFRDFYTKDWQKFIDYNIVDVELVSRLEEKMKLIELAVALAYDAKVNMQDVYYQVRMWDTLIYNFLKKKGIVVPPGKRSDKDDKYAGAYVKEPIAGRYSWVVSFDLNSLYPHLIMQYNISPETLVEKRHPSATVNGLLSQSVDVPKEFCLCANGAMYRKDIHGFLPEMMKKIYDERVQSKKLMILAKQEYEKTPTKELEKSISKYNNIQMARKIQLNSAYGAIGNQYFRYYNIINAEAITLSGQVSIRWIEHKMNTYLNKILKTEKKDYVIASDTDSIYLNLGDLVKKVFEGRETNDSSIVSFLNKVCEMELEKYISSSYEALATYVNAYEQKMIMKRENIASTGIWTAKKRYMLNVWDSEGVRYQEPKLKMMGIEAVKSSTPMPCRNAIKDAIKIMMNGSEDDLISYIDTFRKTFDNLPPEDIAFPRSVNGLRKYKASTTVYTKGTPLHVRGTLLYNFHIEKNNLEYKYPLVQEGEKIKYLHLRRPNKINENVVSFLNTFPKELGLEGQIDRDAQFKKSFLDPLQIITSVIGWETERKATLDFLFA
ncbi:DNA polymerase [Prochlorococcus phage MED4-213]|uniref:DNA-directed DNA polymerase n=1 Tax=Prochlorococcus phage MED4-213 TaxID=889956 RepID=M4QDP2_9CAUD|nr:DNA polymerase [Prochlorococcus phage MED4-213]AGH26288.1 DNA polymerase [Prochlorococcus phage MED4-213]